MEGHWRAVPGPSDLTASGKDAARWALAIFGWSPFADTAVVTPEAVAQAARLFRHGIAVAFDGLHCRHIALPPLGFRKVAATL